MFITHIYLKNYKPLLNVPIEELSVDFNEAVQLIIGDNGSGKSSLLHELCPLPAIKSSYSHGGVKRLIIVHNNVRYVLTSDFNKSNLTHSFIKGGIELNESGKSTIQTELCEKEFNYTQQMSDLLGWRLPITQIPRVERRDLLFSMYPSDLSLVIEKHRTVVAKLRKAKNNLAMIQDMIESLRGQLMSQETLMLHTSTRDTLLDRINELNKLIDFITQENRRWMNHPAYRTDSVVVKHEAIVAQANLVRRKSALTRKNDTLLSTSTPLEETERNLLAHYDRLSYRIGELSDMANDLVGSITEYEQIGEIDPQKEIDELNIRLGKITCALQDLPIDASYPNVTLDQALTVHARIEAYINQIRELGVKVPTRDELDAQYDEIRTLTHQVMSCEQNIKNIEQELKTLTHDYDTMTLKVPSPDCKRNCGLRTSYQNMINGVRDNIQRLTRKSQEFERTRRAAKQRLNVLENGISGSNAAWRFCDSLEIFLNGNSVGVFILNRQSLVDVSNNNLWNLTSRSQRVLEHTKQLEVRAKLQQERDTLLQKIEVLKNIKLPANVALSKFLTDKKVQLKKWSDQIVVLRRQRSAIDKRWNKAKTLLRNKETLIKMMEEYDDSSAMFVLQKVVAFNQNYVRGLTDRRNVMMSELAELERQLNKQAELRNRLNDSLEPQLREIQLDYKQLIDIEKVLSPNSGFPHKYLVKFINVIIHHMNEMTQRVWGYPLEMVHVDAELPLDYNFPVMVGNREVDVLKDCTMCSKGEKAMLDVSWMFALYCVRKLGDIFPLRIDEPDGALSHGNRARILDIISESVKEGVVQQLFMVNHFHTVFDSFDTKEVLCLNSNNVVLPAVYNTHCRIV